MDIIIIIIIIDVKEHIYGSVNKYVPIEWYENILVVEAILERGDVCDGTRMSSYSMCVCIYI